MFGLTAAPACEDATGGAVDLSWTIRTTEATEIDCDAAGVEWIRLSWQMSEAAGGETGSRRWRCTQARAITQFEIPAGDALLSIEPMCATGTADPATFITPAPVQRTIEPGQAISLGSVIVSVRVAVDGQGTDCAEEACFCQ